MQVNDMTYKEFKKIAANNPLDPVRTYTPETVPQVLRNGFNPTSPQLSNLRQHFPFLTAPTASDKRLANDLTQQAQQDMVVNGDYRTAMKTELDRVLGRGHFNEDTPAALLGKSPSDANVGYGYSDPNARYAMTWQEMPPPEEPQKQPEPSQPQQPAKPSSSTKIITTKKNKKAIPKLDLSTHNLEGTKFKTNEEYWQDNAKNFLMNHPIMRKNYGSGLAMGGNILTATDEQLAGTMVDMFRDQKTAAEIQRALSTGDLNALQMLFPTGDSNSVDTNDESIPLQTRLESMVGNKMEKAMKAAWWQLTPEEQAGYLDAGKKCVWNGIKQDLFKNLPIAASLWCKYQGWDQLGEFAANPLYFYLTLGGLVLGGGALLAGAFDDDDDDEESADTNPYELGMSRIPYQ
jgi:hypothetical protein